MSTHAISLYPVLFETLSNNSDEVVIKGLAVLAEIVNCTNKSKGIFFFIFNIHSDKIFDAKIEQKLFVQNCLN